MDAHSKRPIAPPGAGPPRLIRQTAAAPLVAGAATITLPAVPVGHHAYYYRVAVAGQVGGATIALYAGEVNDNALLDWGDVVPAGVGEVFSAGTRGYQIDPGAALVVSVASGGTGEAAVNAYYQLVQHYEASEVVPIHYPLAEPAVDAPAQGIVDYYPAHTSEIPRAIPGGWQRPPAAPEELATPVPSPAGGEA